MANLFAQVATIDILRLTSEDSRSTLRHASFIVIQDVKKSELKDQSANNIADILAQDLLLTPYHKFVARGVELSLHVADRFSQKSVSSAASFIATKRSPSQMRPPSYQLNKCRRYYRLVAMGNMNNFMYIYAFYEAAIRHLYDWLLHYNLQISCFNFCQKK